MKVYRWAVLASLLAGCTVGTINVSDPAQLGAGVPGAILRASVEPAAPPAPAVATIVQAAPSPLPTAAASLLPSGPVPTPHTTPTPKPTPKPRVTCAPTGLLAVDAGAPPSCRPTATPTPYCEHPLFPSSTMAMAGSGRFSDAFVPSDWAHLVPESRMWQQIDPVAKGDPAAWECWKRAYARAAYVYEQIAAEGGYPASPAPTATPTL